LKGLIFKNCHSLHLIDLLPIQGSFAKIMILCLLDFIDIVNTISARKSRSNLQDFKAEKIASLFYSDFANHKAAVPAASLTFQLLAFESFTIISAGDTIY